jgi:hypothetical protein
MKKSFKKKLHVKGKKTLCFVLLRKKNMYRKTRSRKTLWETLSPITVMLKK